MGKPFGKDRWAGLWVVIAVLLMQAGCVSASKQMSLDSLMILANGHGLAPMHFSKGEFPLMSLVDPKPRTRSLRVYIEGDGLAWKSPHMLSDQPTPIIPLSLFLMLEDPYPDRAYLGRPCQYLQNANCTPSIWSSKRHSPELIHAMDDALNHLKARGGFTSLELVGFSGGGGVAALLAASRQDVKKLVTVAANLDTGFLATRHGISSLFEVENPLDVATELGGVFQVHFSGENDPRVPPEVAASFMAALPETAHARARVVKGATHMAGWRKSWKRLLKEEGL